MQVAMWAAVGVVLVRGGWHVKHALWDACMMRVQPVHVQAPGVADPHGMQKPEMLGMSCWHVGHG